jgi:acetylornithine deacetylase
MALSDRLHARLAELVAFDTQNPSGDERGMVQRLAAHLTTLGAARVDAFAAGAHHGVYAAFGPSPSLLINAHVDTVPANAGYTSPPHELVARDGRLYGLGAADTKGAIACILEALETCRDAGRAVRDVAVLFSGDEESGGSVMNAFLESDHARGLTHAIVCEPTGCRIGVRHRGIAVAKATARSPGGHSSRADDLPAPVVATARAAVALHAWGRRYRNLGPAGYEGLCVNVAAIDGGLAFNVVPTYAVLTVSLRPWPGADVTALLEEAQAEARAAAAPDPLEWEVPFANPPLATRDVAAFARWLPSLRRGTIDLQFWTEAALLSSAGVDAVVFGPGAIAQAHAPDEYVEIAELVEAHDAFVHVLAHDALSDVLG